MPDPIATAPGLLVLILAVGVPALAGLWLWLRGDEQARADDAAMRRWRRMRRELRP